MISRYDFCYLFDVKDGNPNGDPDAGNLPRADAETGQGLVTDVCLKRKVRNYVCTQSREGFDIFVKERQPLNPLIAEAARSQNLPTYEKKGGGWDTNKSKSRTQSEIQSLQKWLCQKYFDIRTFGAVMSTGPNAGQIRGPVQLTFGRSIEPILHAEHCITRVTDVDKEEGEMGRKFTIPYGLYRVHGFINPHLAAQTGFNQNGEDLELFWTALAQMFEIDRSAARGEMAPQALIVFEHESALGNAPANKLFERVIVRRVGNGDGTLPARSFADYEVIVNSTDLPSGITIHRKL